MEGEGIEIVLTIDKKEAYVNGKLHTLAAQAVFRDSRMSVPVRLVLENVNMKVLFDDEEIFITDAVE
ncbi:MULTISPECIES: stalk domain-containing protein [Paenibacillus]|jgi:hypothetical protein|uniref:Copper amine oxidase-like N-terminal domain-containing protein n=1 Tax=Paenibacillus oceani TaxID=2772510 RepID=A0A927H366_9BACL|nr:stalk domain-containing protein [Paenibacillus oceani]MBD2866103.1 hypothetical protein [Paenibacillus oceani]MDF2658820.1 hypothetical protein [Paenibacillus sp.]